jgi:hypothetical protein
MTQPALKWLGVVSAPTEERLSSEPPTPIQVWINVYCTT